MNYSYSSVAPDNDFYGSKLDQLGFLPPSIGDRFFVVPQRQSENDLKLLNQFENVSRGNGERFISLRDYTPYDVSVSAGPVSTLFTSENSLASAENSKIPKKREKVSKHPKQPTISASRFVWNPV